MGLLLWGGAGRAINIKTLCQICANLIGTSWHLVTQPRNEGHRKSN